ncbi:unnamed protein product, partial [Ectocarpus sp. 12 AP-2014]
MAGTPADGAAMEDDEEPPVISPREGLQERLRKARERRKRRASGDVLPGGEGKRHHRPAATAMPETPMAGPLPAYAMQGSPAGQEDQGGGMPTQEVEAVKASSTSLAQKRALLQQQRKQRKLDADRMLARRQSGQMGPSSKLEPGMSPAAADQQGEQPRLFDEFNDDDDDDYDGGYGYGAVEGKGSGVKVVLVAPNSSPAMPSAAKKSSGCCGGGPVPKRETRSEADAKRATTEGGDAIPPTHPHPVLASGWAGGDGARAYWNIPGGSLEARREEEARKDASAAEAGKEEGEEALLGKGRTDGSGTERVRRVWVAARDGDERRRLLKEEEGLAVGQLPKSAPGLMRRGAVQDRLLRDAVFARAEEDERAVWRDLQGGTTEGDVTDGLDCESMYGDGQAHRPHRAPSATVFPSGRGPSQASDFFSARGAPSILEDPLEPLPMRVERPPADEIPPPPAYLEAYVRRPTAGIGPEARLAGLDERTELRIVVPRVAFHDHPLFANEDRLGASLRKLFGRYRAKLAADEELYLRRRLSASLSALLSLRAQIDGAQETSSAAGSAVVAFKMGKRTRERANWLLRDSLTTLASVLAEKDEVLRLERTMNATWSDLEEDRRERGISSTGTRLTERKVEKRDGNEIRATAAGWGNNDEIDEEDDNFFSSRGEGGRKLDGSSLAPLDQQLSQLESFLGWLSAQDSLQSLARSGEAAATGGGNTSEVSEGRTKKHNRAEERRRRDTRKKLELVIGQCRTSLGGRSGGTDEGSHVLRLSNDGIVTPDVGCGRLERARREEARELRFRLAVFVNGSKVSTTRAVPFEWPEFACSFNHLVRLRLVRRPESVMVAIYSCSGVPWWPDQEVASVWVPVPGGQDNRFGDSMGAGPQTTHAFAPRTQWTQFSSRRPMATSGPLAGRRTCGSVLVGTDWSTSRDGTEDTTSGGVFSEGDNASAPTLPVRGGADSYSHLTLREIFNALWTAEGRSKLRAKPLQGLRSSQLGTPGGRGEAGGSKGGGGGASGAEDGDASRTIPDFAREADFLHLLPCGADIDPNDPRHGNLMRMRGLLSTLDLDRRESSVVARGPRAGSGLGPTRRPASARGGASAGAGNEGVEDGGEEEDTGVFRASQEQQALVFAGKRIASGLTGGAGRADVGGGRGGFRTFAFNNHRRWKEPLRHTLIRLRVQKPTLFGNRPIPLREDDIRRDETLTAILAQEAVVRAHRHEASGRRGSLIFDGEADVELDADKQKKRMAVDHGRVMDFVQRVRDSRTAQARRQALKRVTYSSVVQEGAVPQLGINFEGGSFFPKPKRALRPEPKERAAATIQLDECRLLLQIVSARNVPVRSEEGAGGLPASTAMAIPKQQQPGMRADSGGPLSDDEDFE